ncbi:ornithine cyclodeaminase family protein [Shewanella sp. D64]|uniref:iminosuccinate reductase BhcD n=1 Tax=unclassified Shewanella TaxID=196818 RepID=UPI0022BA2C4E|nr:MULTISPECIES: iminosuccinate reductase BhcD [unclassified Shewanella]MEC4725213.1 ornithine cyclodeaminase family protein [Shewanella sp. D64]MEC4735941.1 ornithine cyclodeaminase family protein [Shewanella sp. E94]WBJ93093.1 ornithine cyclodeaminase family protein [Shewanella sp. MTB7]
MNHSTPNTHSIPSTDPSTNTGITLVSEAVCQQVMGRTDAFSAVEKVFSAMAKDTAYNFPVIREAIGHADALYGFKSGFDREGMVLGLKSGGYWPGNTERQLTNHQSTIILFDPDTGRLVSLVGGNYLTAIRTAASSAVSINHLARKNARTLGIIGAGHQSSYQLQAALEQRPFEKVLAWNNDASKLTKLAKICDELSVPFESVSRETLCAQSDVIITITSAFQALINQKWIKPGTHIACMGTDTKGKQEVDAELFTHATVFTDELTQSTTIGEAQHAVAAGLIDPKDIIPIGDVINGSHPGRTSDNEITLFDGTGVGLQDLAVASVAVKLAQAQGKATYVNL